MFLPAALVKHVLMPLLDVKSTEALERTSKSVYASMQTRDSLRAYDCLKIMHRDVQAAVKQQAIDVHAALQYIRDAIARNEFIEKAVDRNESVGHLLPFPRNEALYKQGWALKYMHYLWTFYGSHGGRCFAASFGGGFDPFGIEHVERIYGWLDIEFPHGLRAALARLEREH
jgi:hypothetical protein